LASTKFADPTRTASVIVLERSFGGAKKSSLPVRFDRRELTIILDVYGRMVARGEWRDYALDMLGERALFSIYKRASEVPLFVIEKNPRLRAKQGMYAVTNLRGRVLKRGHDLGAVLKVLDHDFVVIK
jgi:uncharacterized protein DUF2794